jgi:hypothetical protein
MKVNKIFLIIILLSVTVAIMLFNLLSYISFLKKQNNLLASNFNNLMHRIIVLESEKHAKMIPLLIPEKVASTSQIKETKETKKQIKGRTSDLATGNKGYLLKDIRPTN